MLIAFDMFIAEQTNDDVPVAMRILLARIAMLHPGYTYVIITGQPEHYQEQTTIPNIQLYPLKPILARHTLMQHQLLLRKALRRIKPDILHVANCIVPIGWHKPFVLSIYNLPSSDIASHQPLKTLRDYWQYLLRDSLQRAHTIIAHSAVIYEKLVSDWSIEAERIQLIETTSETANLLQTYQHIVCNQHKD